MSHRHQTDQTPPNVRPIDVDDLVIGGLGDGEPVPLVPLVSLAVIAGGLMWAVTIVATILLVR